MVRVVIFSACTLLVAVQASSACESVSDRSVVFAENTMPICEDMFNSLGVLSIDSLNWNKAEESQDDLAEGYWDEWAIQSENTPLLTQSLEKNYFGLGIWMPDELRDEENEMSTEEWLLNHGLMFSVGFGDKNDGKPRMRFDYRWHEYYDADWMMQVEVPF